MFTATSRFVAATITRILDAEAAADDDLRRRRPALGNMLRTHVAATDIAEAIRQAGAALTGLSAEKVITRTECTRALGALPDAVPEFARCAHDLTRHDMLATVCKVTRSPSMTRFGDDFVETEAGQIDFSHRIAPQVVDAPDNRLSFRIRFPAEYPTLPARPTLTDWPDRDLALRDTERRIASGLPMRLIDVADRDELTEAMTGAEHAAEAVDAACKRLERAMLNRYDLSELFPA